MRFTYSFLPILLFSVTTFAELPRITANGTPGQDGRDGQSWSGRPSRDGADGRDGGHATHPTQGENAGDIAVALNEGPVTGTVIIKGTIRHQGHRPQLVEETATIGTSSSIVFEANGGKGGNGGRGGRGQDGADGAPGRDADRFSSGGNGGDGGDGGDGGSGTSGARGGDGGNITVDVDVSKTGLLMLVEHSEKGGTGGEAGTNGRGGRGGDGGRGGRSHTWVTHHTRKVQYKDPQGNTKTRDEPYTIEHTNQGGHRGSDGRNGRTARTALTNGPDGAKGKYTIRVHDGQNVTEYAKRYNLILLSYEVSNADGNGIFEFGENATVSRLQVRNSGGMPTPPNYEIQITLRSNGRVISTGERLVLPKSLAPNENYTFENESLSFQIADFLDEEVAAPGERLVIEDVVAPRARLESGISRDFRDFDKKWNFQITFPVEISPIHTLTSVVPGEKTKVVFTVKNISEKAFGSESDLKRQISTMLKLKGSEVGAEHLEFVDSTGTPVSLENGFFSALANLEAGKERVIEGTLEVKNSAPAYKAISLGSSLSLGTIVDPSKERTVQNRAFEIRIGQTYSKSPDADILLVPNQGTTAEEIAFWKNVAGRIGKKIDIWDLSVNGFIELYRNLKNGSSLAKDWEGKTIVLLNNPIPVADGQTKAWPVEFLGREDLIKATARDGGSPNINFVVWGPASGQKAEDLMRALMLPTVGQEGSLYGDESSYEDAFEGKETKALVPTDTFSDSVSVSQRFFLWWRQPRFKHLKSKADKFSRALSRIFPDKRMLVVTRFEPAKTGFGKWNLGTVEVRRMQDVSDNSVVIAEVHENRMHNPTPSDAELAIQTLFLGMNFEDRVALFKLLLEYGTLKEALGVPELSLESEISDERLANALVDSLLVDLAVEQAAVRHEKWRAGMSRKRLLESMPKLRYFSENAYNEHTTPGMDGVESRALVRLAAGIAYMSARLESWTDNLLSLGGLLPIRRNSTVSRITDKLLEQYFKNAFNLHVAKDVRDIRRTIKREIESAMKRFDAETGGKRERVMEHMLSLLRLKELTGDVEVYDTPVSRVMNGPTFDDANKKIIKRDANRKMLMDGNNKAQCDFLIKSERNAE